ncbi:MAG: endopeptidase La [Nitrospiraceae bacterium]|nr:MAG: endopeptidase La [Nitrospiraceae bacterium]
MGIFNKRSDEQAPLSTVEELRQMIADARMPQPVEHVASRELEMLARISPSTAEYTIGLTYIEYLISLPWNSRTTDNLDLQAAVQKLNERHYGLQKIKERIVEHLAVKILSNSRKPSILLVDDEQIALENLKPVLEKEGYDVDTAESGAAALCKTEETLYDVVLTDLKMKHVDGLEVLEKTKFRNPEAQVIMITGYGTIDSAVAAMKKGAFHYITKPLRLDEVRTVVRNALDKRFYFASSKGSVLCFAGPPGTGKTSLGKAVAEALGRKFARISLGGMKDEAEIRGHRRTYAGAMPGRIIEELRRTGVMNPVVMLDELDKVGTDFKGDSASALLEALDPEQNHSFIDHYLDVPFDLSRVMFIATANVADSIPDALKDRLEVIEFPGYTEDEKIDIARRHLIPKHIREKGIAGVAPVFNDEAVAMIIRDYTREAGIRNLEREIAAICRKIAVEVVSGSNHGGHRVITPECIERYLGPRKYYFEVADEKNRAGVTTGLVWTETGGSIIFVEAAEMKGNGELILTGSLGEVMRESAQAALSYIRSNARSFSIDDDFFKYRDIHIHVPAGAIPKDGPSAGSAIALALLSLLTGRAARRNVALTGELTLSGRVLPVAGIRQKLLAARQAGVRAVILPAKNSVDAAILPPDAVRGLDIRYMDILDDAIDLVLE